MDNLDPVLLARIQFAFTVSFHIVFPALLHRARQLSRRARRALALDGRDHYIRLFRIWVKAFALAFGMGVVSGIVLCTSSAPTGASSPTRPARCIGPLMGYEVLTAFFLEAGFLGIMLFGVNRVPKRGALPRHLPGRDRRALSAFWILAANSWMQTPAGYAINDGGPVRARSTGSRSSSIRRSPTGSSTWCSRPISRPRSWSARRGAYHLLQRPPRRRRPAPCFRWRCGWRRSWRRCSSSSATSTASTR